MTTVVVSPYNVANFSEGGGHFWVYMQYVLGLRQLGCEVYWLESFRGTGDEQADGSQLAPFLARMEQFGMDGKTLLYRCNAPRDPDGLPESYFGKKRAEVEAIFERAD